MAPTLVRSLAGQQFGYFGHVSVGAAQEEIEIEAWRASCCAPTIVRINQTAVKTYSARLSRPPSLLKNHDLRDNGQISHLLSRRLPKRFALEAALSCEVANAFHRLGVGVCRLAQKSRLIF